MKKCFAVGIIVLFIAVVINPVIAQNADRTSESTSNGNWLYVGGTGPGNYSKIQDAIDNASDRDTVFVFSGVYLENVYVNKSINLLGENCETTVIDANGTGHPVLLVSNNITLSGFTILNGSTGVYSYKNDGNIIKNNKISNNYFGIQLYYLSNNTVSDNKIYQNRREGIFTTDSYLSIIQNNEIINNNGFGISFSHSDRNKIINNYISGNNANDPNFHANILLFQSFFNDISKNTISNHSEVGIALGISYGNRICYNNFINNTKDIVFEYGLHWALLGNRFFNNYWDAYLGIGPKIIIGSYMGIINILIPIIKIPWFEFDLFPARKPHNIGV